MYTDTVCVCVCVCLSVCLSVCVFSCLPLFCFVPSFLPLSLRTNVVMGMQVVPRNVAVAGRSEVSRPFDCHGRIFFITVVNNSVLNRIPSAQRSPSTHRRKCRSHAASLSYDQWPLQDAHTHTRTHTQPLNGLWSGTTWVSRFQKKHSPTHTHPDHRTSFTNFLHLLRSIASSLFSLLA